jgi:hypothetical protein
MMLRNKIDDIENSMQHNKKTVDDIKQIVRDLAAHETQVDWKKLHQLIQVPAVSAEHLSNVNFSLLSNSEPVILSSETCSFSDLVPPKADVQVRNILTCELKLSFSVSCA